MLLGRSRFHASSCLTAGCSVTNSSRTAALSFQTEYNWKQKILLGAVLPGLLGIGGSLLSLICACAYVCTLALTLTQEQTCLSEVAANPGRGSENSSPSWERSLGGMLQKKTQSDFPWCGWRDKHLPSSGSEFGEMSRREKTSALLPFSRCLCPFIFSSHSDNILRDAGHPESPWATRTAPRTTRWVRRLLCLLLHSSLDYTCPPPQHLCPEARADTASSWIHVVYLYLWGHCVITFSEFL